MSWIFVWHRSLAFLNSVTIDRAGFFHHWSALLEHLAISLACLHKHTHTLTLPHFTFFLQPCRQNEEIKSSPTYTRTAWAKKKKKSGYGSGIYCILIIQRCENNVECEERWRDGAEECEIKEAGNLKNDAMVINSRGEYFQSFCQVKKWSVHSSGHIIVRNKETYESSSSISLVGGQLRQKEEGLCCPGLNRTATSCTE